MPMIEEARYVNDSDESKRVEQGTLHATATPPQAKPMGD